MRVLPILSASILVLACGPEAPATAPEEPDIVGIMEVPLAYRSDGPVPADALRIQMSSSELQLEGHRALDLTRGRFAPAEIGPDGTIPHLAERVRAAPARQRAKLVMHGLVGYGTLARTIATLQGVGYREFSLAVRPVGGGGAAPAAFSWLALSAPRIMPAGAGPIDPTTIGGTNRQWSEFTSHWAESYEACRGGHYIDCDPVPAATPEDGLLQVVLWARGQGMQVRFHRVGAPPPPDPREEALTKQRAIVARGRDAPEIELPPTPEVTGTFSFRADEATNAEGSAITLAVRPICGAAPCQTMVEADEETPVMRVLSLFGAVFPNGSPMPDLLLRLPETPAAR